MWIRFHMGVVPLHYRCTTVSTWEHYRCTTVASRLVHRRTTVRSPSPWRGDNGKRILRTQDSPEPLNHDMRKSLVINDPFWRFIGRGRGYESDGVALRRHPQSLNARHKLLFGKQFQSKL